MGIHQPLFGQRFEWQKMPDALHRSIETMPDSVVLADDKAALAELTRAHRLEVPQLNLPGEDEHVGDAIVRSIAFTGTAMLFSVQPATSGGPLPEGVVVGDRLLLSVGPTSDEVAQTYFSVQEQLITQWLSHLIEDVADHNAHVDRAACFMFERRQELSSSHRHLVEQAQDAARTSAE